MAANPDPSPRWRLVREVLGFQVKLLMEAARDLLLSPLSIGALALDVLLSPWRRPTLFYQVLRFGERSDHWIDLWGASAHAGAAGNQQVDALMSNVAEVLRDPQIGARKARVLKRWAAINLGRRVGRLPGGKPPDGGKPAK